MNIIDKIRSNFVIIGHRGLPSRYPENTFLSFKNAFKYTDIVELDVHLSKDNTVYVIHDFNLKRLANVDRNIEDMYSYEINSIKIKNENIPELSDLLSNFNDKYFLIELKTIDDSGNAIKNDITKKTIEVIKKSKMKDHVCIISFNPFSLNEARLADNSIQLGLDYCKTSKKYMELDYNDLKEMNISLFLPEFNMECKNMFTELIDKGICVIPWAIDNQKDALDALNMNLNGIITNKVDKLSSMRGLER